MGLEGLSVVSLTRSELEKLRFKALRRRVWFRVLSRIERGMIGLVIKTVRIVRSLELARSLTSVVKKLLTAMESRVSRQISMVGCPLAQKLSRIAQGWGHKSAIRWVTDRAFAQFLAVNHMNTSYAFRDSS